MSFVPLRNKKETPFYTSLPGFYVVEAAVALPVFISFFAGILFFFSILQIQLQVQTSLNYAAKRTAEYAVMESSQPEKMNDKTELAAAEVLFRSKLKEQKIRTDPVMLGMSGISLLNSDLAGDFVHLKAVYRMKIPLGLLGSYTVTVHQQAKARKWTGGGAFHGETGEWVYITPAGMAYHRSSQCPYLDLSIRAVEAKQIGTQRNRLGGKYRRCQACGKLTGRIVYITDYGEVYHGSLGCIGLKRSVQKVKVSEAGSRHACTKCGG